MESRGVNALVAAGGVLVGLVIFGIWLLLTVALTYGVSSAFDDTAATVILLAVVILPLAAAVLLLVLPGTRVAGAGFVGGLAGGFVLAAVGALLLAWAAGFSL